VARSVSAEFRSLLTRSREFGARVELLDADRRPVTSTDPTSSTRFDVAELSVSVDETRTVRGNARCVITVPPASQWLVPTSATGLLSPISGATFRVWSGFRLPSTGRFEMVPCGRYDIERCSVNETAAGIRIELEGEDMTGRLDVADFTSPFGIIFGANKIETVKLMVSAVIPEMRYLDVPSDQYLGWGWLDVGANRLSEINSIMTSMGYAAWMDPDGESMHLEPVASTEDVAAWVFDESSIRVVSSVQNSLDRSRVYNGVIASGENTQTDVPPVRAEAWDTDPTSPTYFIPGFPVHTRIGPRPFFMTSPYITTQEQAQAAANAELLRLRGLLQRVSLKVGVNPAVNVGDVIDVTRPNVGVIGRYVVQSLSFDLAQPGAMDLVCEERRVAVG
jgi:hypothetical protein